MRFATVFKQKATTKNRILAEIQGVSLRIKACIAKDSMIVSIKTVKTIGSF